MAAGMTGEGLPGPALTGAHGRDLRLDAVDSSARLARDFARSHLGEVERDTLDSVLLVTTELVTNAVLHASRGPIDMRIEVNPASVLVRVFDSEPREPTMRPHHVERTNGRGIALVSMVSAEWGTVLHDGGKTVWALVHRR